MCSLAGTDPARASEPGVTVWLQRGDGLSGAGVVCVNVHG